MNPDRPVPVVSRLEVRRCDDGSLLLVRFLPGYVGEARRVVHVVPVVNTAEVPPMLVAYCGEPIERGTAEVLPEIGGMPCIRCVLATPSPFGAEATAVTPRGNAVGELALATPPAHIRHADSR